MLVYYFVSFIVSNLYLLFWVSNGHKSVTVQNRTHVYVNFFDHKYLGNHLLQLCPKVVKHSVYLYLCLEILVSSITFNSIDLSRLIKGWPCTYSEAYCGLHEAFLTSDSLMYLFFQPRTWEGFSFAIFCFFEYTVINDGQIQKPWEFRLASLSRIVCRFYWSGEAVLFSNIAEGSTEFLRKNFG